GISVISVAAFITLARTNHVFQMQGPVPSPISLFLSRTNILVITTIVKRNVVMLSKPNVFSYFERYQPERRLDFMGPADCNATQRPSGLLMEPASPADETVRADSTDPDFRAFSWSALWC